MEKLLTFIFTLGLKPLYDKNLGYYKILSEFRDKLPRHQNQAKVIGKDKTSLNPVLNHLSEMFTVLDLSTQKVSLSETEIDLFYNRLNNFDYSFILFKKHCKEFTRNLNRFQPTANNRNFDIAVIQRILEEEQINPFKPWNAFIFHLKFRYKLTSRLYISYLDRKRGN